MAPVQRQRVSARFESPRATVAPPVLATAFAIAFAIAFLALLVAPLPPVAANTHAVVAGRAAEVLASVGASGPGTWHKFAVWCTPEAITPFCVPRNDGLHTTKYAVVLIGVPHGKDQNLRLLEDIFFAVYFGMEDLGLDVTWVRCPNLVDGCATEEALGHRQAIVIGSNAITDYHMRGPGDTTLPDERSIFVHEMKLIPDSAILYNLEFIRPALQSPPGVEEARSIPDNQFERFYIIHRRYKVWEYSWSNVLALREHGVHATHVPLGFARNLALPPPLPEAQRDIDVLFFGSANLHRVSLLLEILVGSPSMVLSWPADVTVGPALTALIRRAKIVLILSAFGHPFEHKMSRMMPLFGSGAFIVTERMGCAEDMDFYRPGLVEVDSPLIDGRSPHMLDPDRTQTLVDTLQFYLQQPALRAAIASEGRSRFMSRTMADSIARALGVPPQDRHYNNREPCLQ